MSTSLLYHGFGIRGYLYEKTEYRDGAIHFTISQPAKLIRCSVCGSRDTIRRGSSTRAFRGLPIGTRQVWITFAIPRVECRQCRAVRQVEVPFADGQRSYTRTFERYAQTLLRHMTIKDVALHLGVHWSVIKEIDKRDLGRRFHHIRLADLKQLAIDEISIGKGQRYLTVVLDLESGAVVFIGDGKSADALRPFWRKLKASRAKVEAVAVDLSPAYTLAVRTHLPDAVIVYDHFHLVKLLNEKLSDLRRSLQREAEDSQKEVLKGTRWLLLKRESNLDENGDEKARLQAALDLNAPLAAAYYLKEEFGQLWKQTSKTTAGAFLDDWVARARLVGVHQLKSFAKTLERHRDGILAYYDAPISTGPLEGTNNKIKTLQRQAYGFRDREYFKLKIFALHESRYALVG
jgi:transposase